MGRGSELGMAPSSSSSSLIVNNGVGGSTHLFIERVEHWRHFNDSVNEVSFGLVATAILISMFFIMAIFKRFLIRPRSSPLSSPSVTQTHHNLEPQMGFNGKIDYPCPKKMGEKKKVYNKDCTKDEFKQKEHEPNTQNCWDSIRQFGTTTVGIITESAIFLAADGMVFTTYKDKKPIPTGHNRNKVFHLSCGRLALMAGDVSICTRTLNRLNCDNDEQMELGKFFTVYDLAIKCGSYIRKECATRSKVIEEFPNMKESLSLNAAITIAGYDHNYPTMWVISIDTEVDSEVNIEKYDTCSCEGHGREIVEGVFRDSNFSRKQGATETEKLLLDIMIAASASPFCGGILRGYRIDKGNKTTCLFEDHVDDLTEKVNCRKIDEWLAE